MKKLGLLLAPVLFAMGCGGLDDVLNGVDGGVCGGKDPHRLPAGNYGNNGTVTNFSSTCNATYIDPTKTVAALNTAVRGFNNTMGTDTCFLNSGSNTNWACFLASCNVVSPNAKSQAVDDTVCNCNQTVSLSGTVDSIGVLSLAVKVNKSNCLSSSGSSCPQTTACEINYNVKMTGPSS